MDLFVFVLGEKTKPSQAGITAIQKCEVKDAEDSAEWDDWFCAIYCEGK
jgi:hypothetical protein